MPESDNQKSTPKKPVGTAEIGVEKRLLIAFALMGAVLFLTQYFYPQPSPQKTIKPVQQATPQQAEKPAAPAESTATSPQTATAQTAAVKSELYTIDTDVYRVVFSNHGAVVRSWDLKQYRDGTGKPLQLVNAIAATKAHYPFAIVFENQAPSTDLNRGIVCSQADGRWVGYRFRVLERSFRCAQEFPILEE